MTRTTVKEVEATVNAANLKLVVNKAQKGVNKYVVTDEHYNPVYGANTLAEITALHNEYLTSQPAPKPETTEVEPLTCDVLEGEWNGQFCSITAKEMLADELSGQVCLITAFKPATDNYWERWQAAYTHAKRQLIGKTEAAKHVVVMTAPPESAPKVCSPAIIGFYILVAFALMIDGLTWAIKQVIDRLQSSQSTQSAKTATLRLVQRGFAYATAAVKRRLPNKRGFATT